MDLSRLTLRPFTCLWALGFGACTGVIGGPAPELFAATLERLAAMPEGDGSVLDRTLVLWTNECWHGNHDPFRLPLVVGGGRALGLETGRVYSPPDGEGRQYGKLLVSLANAVGLPMTSFGDPRWGEGPLPGLFSS